MKNIVEKLNSPRESGVFQLTSRADAIEQAAKSAGLTVFKIDVKRLRGKAGLLAHLARVLEFPHWFGKNWDALHDCLTDLSWFDEHGYVIFVENAGEFAARYPKAFSSAIEVFQSAAEHWRSAGKAFWVLVDGPSEWNSGLERFPPN